jgi:type IV pilus assembly protein PilM
MSLSFFQQNNDEHVVGVDIGKSSIKAVQLKKEHNTMKLVTYGEIFLGNLLGQVDGKAVSAGEDLIVSALITLYKEAKITAKKAIFSVDPASTFVTTIPISREYSEDLLVALSYEARKYLPVPLSTVDIDHWLIPPGILKEDQKYIQVVLAAIKHDTLTLYSRIAQRLGVQNPLFEIEAFSLKRSLLGDGSFSIIVDIGAQYSTVTLVHKEIILDVHLIPRGSQESTTQLAKALSLSEAEAEKKKKDFGYDQNTDSKYVGEVMKLSTYPLFGDIGRLLLMYERKYNQIVDKIIFTGSGSRVNGISLAAGEVIKGDIILANPFQKIDTPSFLHDMLKRVGPSYSVSVGLALKGFEE